MINSVYHSTGVNLIETGVRLLLGEKIDVTGGSIPVVARSVFPEQGTIKAMSGTDGLSAIPDLKVVEIRCGVGDAVRTRGINAEINLLASGRSIDELVRLVDTCANGIEFQYE